MQAQLISDKFQIEPIAIFAAPGHALNGVNKSALFLTGSFGSNSSQFENEFVHLKMVEDRLAPGIDLTQEVIRLIVPGREKAAQQAFQVRNLLGRFAIPGF